MTDLRRTIKAKGKAVVVEPDETINIEEEDMDDDFVDTAWDNSGKLFTVFVGKVINIIKK